LRPASGAAFTSGLDPSQPPGLSLPSNGKAQVALRDTVKPTDERPGGVLGCYVEEPRQVIRSTHVDRVSSMPMR